MNQRTVRKIRREVSRCVGTGFYSVTRRSLLGRLRWLLRGK